MDESGIHDGASICVVAGYYGAQLNWRRFEREWRQVLAKPEFAVLECGFHAKEFWGRKLGERVGPYRGWDDKRAEKFLDLLVQVIMRNRIFPFGYGVVSNHFRIFPLDARRMLTGGVERNGKVRGGSPNKPYYVPFIFCVIDSARHSGATDKVHVYAGLDRTFSGYARDLFAQAKKDPRLPIRDFLGTLSFPLSKDTPGIQAADLLVHLLYKHNVARTELRPGERTNKPMALQRIIKNRHAHQPFDLFDVKKLDALLKIQD